jgi:hypothetical protein
MKRSGLFLFAGILSGCGGGGGSSPPVTPPAAPLAFTPISVSSCDPRSSPMLSVGDYAVTNNLWGKGTITNFSQCINATSVGQVANGKAVQTGVTAKWEWSWPSGEFTVKAYPEILYRPNGQALTAIPLSDVAGLTLNHDTTISASGDYNLTYDLWIDDMAASGQWPHKAELMIKVVGTWADSPVVDTVVIDGNSYDVCVNVGKSGAAEWKFLAFTSKTPLPKAAIHVKPFADYLVQHGYLLGTDKISTIEFGSEPIRGSGSVTVNAYSVSR